ncbi:MAG: GAK system XXXCH domain-containing protein [Proteobacteria bacterium]|nr:GAK system XXXCH domain-containing protein [Pseudomonadota bacterium]MBU1716444.1 GAK system XXXCH domain-containing protein [Pseudomonadota bacterium]
MDSKKIKIEKTLHREQIASFLRMMAAAIEGQGGDDLEDYGVDLHSFNKLKLGLVRQQGGQLTLTIKVKTSEITGMNKGNEMDFEDVAETKYRPLKKIIKASFNQIKTSVAENKLPAAAVLDEFLAQVKTMTSYQGFGDEYYGVFNEACRELKEAFRNKDLASFIDLCARVDNLHKECHARYK